jgi:hypothetical protein
MALDDEVAPAVERRYTIAEVAEIACVSRETVYADIKLGALKARRKRHATRSYVVLESELKRWLEDEFEEVPT